MAKSWSCLKRIQEPSFEGILSSSEALEYATNCLAQRLTGRVTTLADNLPSPELEAKIKEEFRQYFTTGNCGLAVGSEAPSASINPTLLHPATGQWFVHYSTCPFDGYLPLPHKPMEEYKKNRITFDHCRKEVMKTLLAAFRNCLNSVQFVFHPCDPLSFCFDEAAPKFDVIDTSNLADHFGLGNLLNASARKLRSAQSILITESLQLSSRQPDAIVIAKYLEKILCCPLSLTPTLYGLRLTGNVRLGSEVPPFLGTLLAVPFCRLRWRKTQPFKRVPLALSPTLDQSIKSFKAVCFLGSTDDFKCRLSRYSPLTFHHVLSDLICRGGIRDSAALFETALCDLPPVFRKSLETTRAWMKNEPIWRVKVLIPFSLLDGQSVAPVLRLILVPIADFAQGVSSAADTLSDPLSKVNHFIDNIGLDVQLKYGGGFDRVVISFLLKDRSLLKTHGGIVIDRDSGSPIFVVSRLSNCQVESFDVPYPWAWMKPSDVITPLNAPAAKSTELIAESCQESESTYAIRFKIHSVRKSKKPSGNSFPNKIDNYCRI